MALIYEKEIDFESEIAEMLAKQGFAQTDPDAAKKPAVKSAPAKSEKPKKN